MFDPSCRCLIRLFLTSVLAQLVPACSCGPAPCPVSEVRSTNCRSFTTNTYGNVYRTSRSINRLRAALNNFVRPFGDLSSARHAVRFNLIGKRCRSHGDDLSFALDMIRSFDATRSAAAKGAVRAAKRMALRIHHGLVKGKSRRKAGSWATQSYVSAVLGPSECKSYCRRIIGLNRRRSMRSRLIKPVISSLEEAIQKIS